MRSFPGSAFIRANGLQKMDAIDAGSVGYLDVLVRYGPSFLTCEELKRGRQRCLPTTIVVSAAVSGS